MPVHYSSIRKLMAGPRVNSIGYLGLIDAKAGRGMRIIKKPHQRSYFCTVERRYREESVTLLATNGFEALKIAEDMKAKVNLFREALQWQKPKSFFLKGAGWRGLDHGFALANKMLLDTAGVVVAAPPCKLNAKIEDVTVVNAGKKYIQRPRAIKMHAFVYPTRYIQSNAQTHLNDRLAA